MPSTHAGLDARRTGVAPQQTHREDVQGASTVPDQYELLLATLARAERELTSGDVAGRNGPLEEASGILFDLLYCLDFKHGGELVPRLAALYGYMGNELLSVGRTGDVVKLAHLRDMITTLRHSWYDRTAA